MNTLQKQTQEENEKKSIYIIDEDFRIVYSSDEIQALHPEAKQGQICYEVICDEYVQCRKCPLREENKGKALLYNNLREEWVSVTSAPIDWPGAGKCNIIMSEGIEENGSNAFSCTADQVDYDELLELNYLNDTYHVVYHGKRKEKGVNRKGKMSVMVRRAAERLIHPEDRERFCQFWLLDRIGVEGIPEEMLVTRHGEFRRRKPNGDYEWVQHVFVPARQTTKSDIFVMSFYRSINDEVQLDNHFAKNMSSAAGGWLHNKEYFFKKVEEVLKKSPDSESWCMLSIDIENLKLFNEWYGRKAGDELLVGISDCLKIPKEEQISVAGYFGNDDFALFTKYEEEQINKLYAKISFLLDSYSNKTGFMPAMGVYEVTSKEEAAWSMYDRAEIARVSVKGKYTGRIKKFDSKMLAQIESKYILFSDVRKALQDKDFTFFLQPKCNMENGKVIGAEALVRWISKEKGMISPGVFIPFLESTGFIAELDTYIWEEVCKWQRKMLDSGAKTIPISVNVSKVDMYSMDVPAYFCELIQKYNLDSKLIEIEITESTYAEDSDFINHVITELRKSGFRVLMDDFGSGYSSLNILKDMEIDVLKIDMRFLDINEENAQKGISILETIFNMASLLGIGVIVEGVETDAQRKFLLKMGGSYAQGYYFYRPLPIQDFEKIIENNENLDSDGFQDKKIEQLYLKDLLGEDMFSEVMINNMLGAVAFYDIYENEIYVKRYNEQYAALIGNMEWKENQTVQFREQFYEEDCQKAFQIFESARHNRYDGAEGDVRRCRPDGTDIWLHLKAFFLKEQDGHATYYGSLRDVTDVYKKNEELKQKNAALQFLNNDMPGGYYRHKYNENCDFIYISQRFLDIFGFTRKEIKEQFDDKFMNMIHPDDRPLLAESLAALEQNGGNYSQPYRMRSKSGYIRVTDQSRLVEYDGHKFFQGIVLCDLDHYKQFLDDESYMDKKRELKTTDGDNVTFFMPCGVFRYEADGKQEFSYVSNSMLAMLGYSRQEFQEKFNNCFIDMVYHEDRERVLEEIKDQIQHRNYDSCEYRIEMADGSLKWVYDRGRLMIDDTGKRWFYVAIMDYDYLKEKYREQEWQQMKYKTLAEIPGMMVYDYEPHLDRLTIEISTNEGEIKTIVTEKFTENMAEHDWLSPEGIEEEKRVIKEAADHPMSGTTKFKACFSDDGIFEWYYSHFKSIVDEDGKVYRLVGRVEKMEK